jgi:hypothetical protein
MSVETGRYRVERRGSELVVVDAWTGRVEGEDGYDTRYPSSRRAVLRFVTRLEQEREVRRGAAGIERAAGDAGCLERGGQAAG